METNMKMKKFIASLSAALVTASAAAFMAMSAYAEDAAQSESSSSNSGSTGSAVLSLILPLVIMFALLYFIAIKPQKKRDREMKDMQESLQVGDEIVTGGGIVGIIVRTGDDTVVIETGGERHKLRIKTWAITENVTAQERIKEAKAAAASKKSESAGLASAKLVDDDEDNKKDKSAEEDKPEKQSKKKKK
jgi:preprotein translocase subunit YajC